MKLKDLKQRVNASPLSENQKEITRNFLNESRIYALFNEQDITDAQCQDLLDRMAQVDGNCKNWLEHYSFYREQLSQAVNTSNFSRLKELIGLDQLMTPEHAIAVINQAQMRLEESPADDKRRIILNKLFKLERIIQVAGKDGLQESYKNALIRAINAFNLPLIKTLIRLEQPLSQVYARDVIDRAQVLLNAAPLDDNRRSIFNKLLKSERIIRAAGDEWSHNKAKDVIERAVEAADQDASSEETHNIVDNLLKSSSLREALPQNKNPLITNKLRTLYRKQAWNSAFTDIEAVITLLFTAGATALAATRGYIDENDSNQNWLFGVDMGLFFASLLFQLHVNLDKIEDLRLLHRLNMYRHNPSPPPPSWSEQDREENWVSEEKRNNSLC